MDDRTRERDMGRIDLLMEQEKRIMADLDARQSRLQAQCDTGETVARYVFGWRNVRWYPSDVPILMGDSHSEEDPRMESIAQNDLWSVSYKGMAALIARMDSMGYALRVMRAGAPTQDEVWEAWFVRYVRTENPETIRVYDSSDHACESTLPHAVAEAAVLAVREQQMRPPEPLQDGCPEQRSVFVVRAYKWGLRDCYNLTLGVYDDFDEAVKDADKYALCRYGKFACEVRKHHVHHTLEAALACENEMNNIQAMQGEQRYYVESPYFDEVGYGMYPADDTKDERRDLAGHIDADNFTIHKTEEGFYVKYCTDCERSVTRTSDKLCPACAEVVGAGAEAYRVAGFGWTFADKLRDAILLASARRIPAGSPHIRRKLIEFTQLMLGLRGVKGVLCPRTYYFGLREPFFYVYVYVGDNERAAELVQIHIDEYFPPSYIHGINDDRGVPHFVPLLDSQTLEESITEMVPFLTLLQKA